MGTNIRPELSKKNGNYISKHRYYELKHFCLQYPEWLKAKQALEGSLIKSPSLTDTRSSKVSNPTMDIAIMLESFDSRIKLIRDSIDLACSEDGDLGNYIFIAVTEGLSFNTMKMQYRIPCEKDMYYDRYRRFFQVLSKLRK